MQVIAFKEQFDPDYFPIEFDYPNWLIVPFADRSSYFPDAYFQINVNKPNSKWSDIYNFIDSTGKPKLVCESTPFRRNGYRGDNNGWYYRLGWNHFLRSGVFNNANSDSVRWEQIKQHQGLDFLPWRNCGDYILIVLQKSGDATLNTMYEKYSTYDAWLLETITNIRKYTSEPIVVRPHFGTSKSVYKTAIHQSGVSVSGVWKDRDTIFEGGASLQQDLDSARIVVGYNSNALVESVCDGIPTVALDQDAVTYPVSINLQDINTPNLTIDRTQWAWDLSYCCWTLAEIRSGIAWQHLKSAQTKAT